MRIIEKLIKKYFYFIILLIFLTLLLVASSGIFSVDKQIEKTAKNSYIFKFYLKNEAIKISSKNGEVTLTGTVSKSLYKDLAEETLLQILNVIKVNNNLIIKNTGGTLSENLTSKIKSTLVCHKNINVENIQISIKDGVVTLEGIAANEAQKELTTEYTKDIEGVKSVRNEMTVLKQKNKNNIISRIRETVNYIDDAAIKVQVKLSLIYHKSTSNLRVRVEAEHGKVSLYGYAKNAAEKDLVTKLVSDINGVSSVNNMMTFNEK